MKEFYDDMIQVLESEREVRNACLGITHVIDCGQNTASIFDATSGEDRAKIVSHDHLLDLPNLLPPGSSICGEYAHFGCPRQKYSLSQPFTAFKLSKWYEDLRQNQIDLWLFPQKSTPRAISWSGLEKGDEFDPVAIYNLLQAFPEISLMRPPRTFEESEFMLAAWEYKDLTNKILNVARRFKYQDTEDQNVKWLHENLNELTDRLDPQFHSCFKLGNEYRYKRANKKEGISAGDFKMNEVSMTQLYSILATLRDYDGILRTKLDGSNERPGWKYIMRFILCMSPFHFKGGIARSNLYYHGARNWISSTVESLYDPSTHPYSLKGKKRGGGQYEDKIYEKFSPEEDQLFRHYRSIYCKGIRAVWQNMRDMLYYE